MDTGVAVLILRADSVHSNPSNFQEANTACPVNHRYALTSEFTEDRQKLTQWRTFIRKGMIEAGGTEL